MKSSSFLEKNIPWLVSLPLAIISYAHPLIVADERIVDFVNSSLTVSALLLGFLATSKSILISYRGTRVFMKLKQTGHIDIMVKYIMSAIFSSLIWLLISFSMYFTCSNVVMTAWYFIASFSLVSFIRVIILQGRLVSL